MTSLKKLLLNQIMFIFQVLNCNSLLLTRYFKVTLYVSKLLYYKTRLFSSYLRFSLTKSAIYSKGLRLYSKQTSLLPLSLPFPENKLHDRPRLRKTPPQIPLQTRSLPFIVRSEISRKTYSVINVQAYYKDNHITLAKTILVLLFRQI